MGGPWARRINTSQEMKSELPFFFPFCGGAAECRAVGLYTSSGKVLDTTEPRLPAAGSAIARVHRRLSLNVNTESHPDEWNNSDESCR